MTKYACAECGTRTSAPDVCGKCDATTFHVVNGDAASVPAVDAVGPSLLESLGGDDGAPAEVLACDAPLGQELAGIERGSVIVLFGPSFCGKSTEAAAVAVALARPFVYIDAERQGKARVRQRFIESGGDEAWIVAAGERSEAKTWPAACEAIRASRAEVAIVDSLSRCAKMHEFDDAMMGFRDVAAEGEGRIVIVISHANAGGGVRGGEGPVYDAEAVVRVDRATWRVDKCRWAPERVGERRRIWQGAAEPPERDAARVDVVPDWWAVLGLPRTASVAEVKSAGRKLALEAHPDQWQRFAERDTPAWIRAAAKARFVEVNLATVRALERAK